MSMSSRLVAPALAAWLVAGIAPAHADTERHAVMIHHILGNLTLPTTARAITINLLGGVWP